MPPESTTPFHRPLGCLLAVDDGKGALGDAPLRLIRMGVDVLLSAELDEAELLARQEGENVRGLLLPSAAGESHVDQVLEAVAPLAGLGADGVVLLGPRMDQRSIDRLRERGVRWRLWQPHEDRDLRFIGWSLLWGGGDQNLRLDQRIPTALPGRAIRRGDERDVLVGDLSIAGAFLETDSPFPAGSQLGIEIQLPNRQLQICATVRWVTGRDLLPGRARGFGVEFLNPPLELRLALEEHLESEIARFYL